MADDIITRDSQGNLAVNTVSSTEANVPYNYDDCFTLDTSGRRALRVVGAGGGGGSVDYSKTVQRATTMPTAGASNAGQQFLYSGATNATYTHGYIYENVKTATYTGTVSFEAATLSGTTVACSGDDFAAFLTEAGADPTPIVSGTMTYEADATGWRLVGKDSDGNTVTSFLEYVEDYEDFGFTFTGTPEDGDVIAFTTTITEIENYAWVRINVQPSGSDPHNKGYFASPQALTEAYPTATAGDYAIVGSTDTVWIWDGDTSAWVDSDRKGQVTSVNNQTGDVTLGINDVAPSQTGFSGRVLGTDGFVAGWVEPEKIQRTAMPQASEEEVDNIYQYVGTTDANYTNGYFYKCVSDGQDPATYSWTQVDVQPTPSGLPDQTGNAGKFLTTDGTDASWSDKPLVNQSTSANEVAVGNNVTPNNTYGVRIGSNITGNTWSSSGIFIGSKISTGSYKKGVYIISNEDAGNTITPTGDVVIGLNAGGGLNTQVGGISIGSYSSTATGANEIAIGAKARCSAAYAIQIGTTGSATTNSDANTFKVANANGNFEIMSADGTIPTDRFTTTPVADGTYVPTLTITSGVASRSWSAPAGGSTGTTATLAVADWSSNTQTVNVTGVTANNNIIVAAAPASQADYTAAGILCTAQGSGTLTFTCSTVPSSAITVNVLILA